MVSIKKNARWQSDYMFDDGSIHKWWNFILILEMFYFYDLILFIYCLEGKSILQSLDITSVPSHIDMINFYDWFYIGAAADVFAWNKKQFLPHRNNIIPAETFLVFHSSLLTRNKCRSTSIKKSATLKSHNKAILKFDAQVLRDE